MQRANELGPLLSIRYVFVNVLYINTGLPIGNFAASSFVNSHKEIVTSFIISPSGEAAPGVWKTAPKYAILILLFRALLSMYCAAR